MKYPWMPLFWGDFLANTMHLSAQEAGAYLFLIAHAWENDGQIPGDWVRLSRIAHVRQNHWKRTWKVVEQFFEPLEGESLIRGVPYKGYSHKRVLIELHRLGKISNVRKAAALQLHSKSTCKSTAKAPANAEQTTPLSTSTSNRESSLDGKGSEAPTGNYRDPGVAYRSPPRKKSNNVLKPLPDKEPPRTKVVTKG